MKNIMWRKKMMCLETKIKENDIMIQVKNFKSE